MFTHNLFYFSMHFHLSPYWAGQGQSVIQYSILIQEFNFKPYFFKISYNIAIVFCQNFVWLTIKHNRPIQILTPQHKTRSLYSGAPHTRSMIHDLWSHNHPHCLIHAFIISYHPIVIFHMSTRHNAQHPIAHCTYVNPPDCYYTSINLITFTIYYFF